MKLIILGQIKSGKNGMKTTRKGHHYPNPVWGAWRDGVLMQIACQANISLALMANGGKALLECPCSVQFRYFKGDMRRRDIPGMVDALFHCFERAGIIKDDALFQDLTWTTGIDRENPRVEVELTPL